MWGFVEFWSSASGTERPAATGAGRRDAARHGAVRGFVALAASILLASSTGHGMLPICPGQQFAAAPPTLAGSFGWSVAMSGQRAVIGAYYDSIGGGVATGAAYVFLRAADGSWMMEARLAGPDGHYGDYMGASVAMDGDRAIVGATGRAQGASSTGVAYIFHRGGAGWTLEATLTGPAGDEFHDFGAAVALQGDRAVISAFKRDHQIYSGQVYCYRRTMQGVWALEARIGPEHTIGGELPGWSVALEGDLALIGAFSLQGQPDQPARAYLFRRHADATWQLDAVISPIQAAADDFFGASVALQGNGMLIGAFQDDAAGHDSGAAYVFRRQSGGAWVQEARLFPAQGHSHNYFGNAVALAGDTAVVGAYQGDGPFSNSGSAYVFRRGADGSWSELATLADHGSAAGDAYGWSVATDGQWALIGAIGYDHPVLASGACYGYVVGGPDCDGNGTPDWCDLAAGSLSDLNHDGVPDGCEPSPIVGDLDADGDINGVDMALFLGQWTGPATYAPCPPHIVADLNADCRVNGLDLALLLGSWGP